METKPLPNAITPWEPLGEIAEKLKRRNFDLLEPQQQSYWLNQGRLATKALQAKEANGR